MGLHDVHWYCAWKCRYFCEVCYPVGINGLGSWGVASIAYTDTMGVSHFRCADHAPGCVPPAHISITPRLHIGEDAPFAHTRVSSDRVNDAVALIRSGTTVLVPDAHTAKQVMAKILPADEAIRLVNHAMRVD